MFDLSSLLISTAWAQEAAAPALSSVEPDVQSTLMKFLPLFLIFAVFYFLLIRPQQKQIEKQTKMIKELKKGDKVITGGGFVGVISKLDGDDYVMVELSKGVEVKVVRSTIQGLVDLRYDNENKKA